MTLMLDILAGANMVAHDYHSLKSTLSSVVLPLGSGGGEYECPCCQFHSLTEDELWLHMPAYHINWPNQVGGVVCPICRDLIRKPILVHMHDDHGPHARASISHRIAESMAGNAKHPVYSSECVVVCKSAPNSYLLVQERNGQGFSLPCGQVIAGESLQSCALRIISETTGVGVQFTGILGIKHQPSRDLGKRNKE